MHEILGEARRRGLSAVEGYVLRDNKTMLQMAQELGFKRMATEGEVARVRFDLAPSIARES
jgi:hypothetical protein